MKKFLVIFTLAASVFATNGYAQEKTPTVVTRAFQAVFTNVNQISWSQVSNLYKAEFTMDEQKISAFFDADGSFIASARNINVQQLPISLQIKLKNKYDEYNVAELIEVNNQAGTSYFLTLDGNNRKLQLKSNSYGDWTSYQKNSNFLK
jgi:hypothetical protein